MIKIEKDNKLMINEQDLVSVKKMGAIYELCYCKCANRSQNIQLIDKDHYMHIGTGEILECKHIENRSQNKASVSQSLKRLRDIINTNVLNPKYCKWITLTYRQEDKKPMTDTIRLYRDFEKFMKRLRYQFNTYHIEYILACEPQASGSWHGHLILIFDSIPPFIPNKTIEHLWKQGFTKIQKLNDIDNVGAYLTAYLGDMEFSKENISTLLDYGLMGSEIVLKEVNEIDGIKLKEPKSFIKGGRLYLYPPNFNLYRCSRGIKKPIKEYWQYSVIKEKAGLRLPTYSKGIKLTDTDNNYNNSIVYEYYNTKRISNSNS
jgi:hypothetical protein